MHNQGKNIPVGNGLTDSENQGEHPDFTKEGTIISESVYALVERIGQGGMGNVWKALRLSRAGHKQFVAMKLSNYSADDSLVKALRSEALLISQLNHDNIAKFIDSGFTPDNRLFIALEYVEGFDLNDVLDMHRLTYPHRHGAVRIPDPLVGLFMLMAARALDYAHTKHFDDGSVGIINRDVSPANFVIDRSNGFVKQIDFGIAAKVIDVKDSVSEEAPCTDVDIAGKLEVMPPEMVLGGSLDCTSDLYCLGMVAYILVTTLSPNALLTEDATLVAELSNVVLNSKRPIKSPSQIIEGVDDGLDAIITRLVRRNKEDRYQSASALMRDLEQYLYSGGVGPTVNSLQAYLRLVSGATDLEKHERQSLGFLQDKRGVLKIREPFSFRPDAARKLSGNINAAIF